MCKYCENGKEIRGKEYEANLYTIKNKTLNVDIDLAYYDIFGNNILDYVEAQDYIEIKYCPFCGRKLND